MYAVLEPAAKREVLPADFHECPMAFLPKGFGPTDEDAILRSPGCARPLDLGNGDSKLLTGAISYPLGCMAQQAVDSRQRGLIRGRSMTDNTIELEAAAFSYMIAYWKD